jgi:hypothetical protein
MNTALENYNSGIFDDPENICDPTVRPRPDHSVFIVGYGTEVGQTGVAVDYWLVQNSWGTWWGDKGFFKIKRGSSVCLIENDVMYPVLKSAVPRALRPIFTPVCSQLSGHVYSSNGVYIKSICVDDFWRTYEDSRVNCLSRGMQLFKLDSAAATETVLRLATEKWTNGWILNELFVDGINEPTCTTINNKEPFGPVRRDEILQICDSNAFKLVQVRIN